MKTLTDAVLFFLAMGLFVIGIYESIITGVSNCYWIFMISLSLLFLYGYRKNQNVGKVKSKVNKKKAVRKKK